MIRTLQLGEELPERLRTGFETGQCDPNWVFLAERDGKKVAILVTAPAHIAVILLRLVATREAHVDDVRQLLTWCFDEFKRRGYAGYVTWVDPTVAGDSAIMGLVRSSGGKQLTNPQVACAGKL